MSNERLHQEIRSLERKIKLLISEHEKLRELAALYQTENQELKTKVSRKDEELSGFQNKIKISKIVENMVVEGQDTTDLKDVIDDYIKEIDKCITHLGEA
ncbi:MAG: hypothetical protein KI790_08345 [Cyclobacteriaceae bacterium]|nr:hypothetical protein [Cyclobacteriaceae bacterium HetDA_MAG_MS6]